MSNMGRQQTGVFFIADSTYQVASQYATIVTDKFGLKYHYAILR